MADVLPVAIRLIGALDPDKPETLDALVAHVAAANSEGMCLFCGSGVREIYAASGGLLWCQSCEAVIPGWVPGVSSSLVSREARERAVKNWQDALAVLL